MYGDWMKDIPTIVDETEIEQQVKLNFMHNIKIWIASKLLGI